MTKNSDKALVIGGSSGIGLAISLNLAPSCRSVLIVDKSNPDAPLPDNISFAKCNLLYESPFGIEGFDDVNILVITAGFGRIAPFETFEQKEIENVFQVNSVALTCIIRHFYPKMLSNPGFRCVVMGSIAGLISSPMISLYSASKSAVCRLTESLNIELEASGSPCRILTVAPGSIKGTRFTGSLHTDLDQTRDLASEIIRRMNARETLYIPDYEKTFKDVLARYHDNPHDFGLNSYRYKLETGRMNTTPQLKTGYLSGTFDLFHIGHLNLLRNARQYCDYLVVGVHKDASHKGKQTFVPFEERCDIVRNIRYVDKVILSEPEDDDIYKKGILKYDYLFVGSDYKGTERFNRYESYFADKDVKIIYFPYTQGTSSTQLRDALDNINNTNNDKD